MDCGQLRIFAEIYLKCTYCNRPTKIKGIYPQYCEAEPFDLSELFVSDFNIIVLTIIYLFRRYCHIWILTGQDFLCILLRFGKTETENC